MTKSHPHCAAILQHTGRRRLINCQTMVVHYYFWSRPTMLACVFLSSLCRAFQHGLPLRNPRGLKRIHKQQYWNAPFARSAFVTQECPTSGPTERRRVFSSSSASNNDSRLESAMDPQQSSATTSESKDEMQQTASSSSSSSSQPSLAPLYRSEGIFSVVKPLDWTSQDVVSFLRKMLEREARERGAEPVRVGSRSNKSRILKVGHGGTLDPLATGVLVIGVGKGTKDLQSYLSGSKGYTAEGQFGFETTTLDMDKTGNITKTAPYDHITRDAIEKILPTFIGTIQQVPPLYSAIKKGGKRLYEQARQGATEQDVEIEAREVVIHKLTLLDKRDQLFSLEIECGGGTYVRSLIRDLAYTLDSVATMTSLERTKQGQFTLENSLVKEEWTTDSIYAAIDESNALRQKS